MHTQTVLLYLLTWSLVALTPGPAVMCAMTQASRHGLRPALVGIAGIQLGHLVFFGCIASGLAALLATASTAFTLIRVVGALYLLYLGVRVILATFRARGERLLSHAPPGRRHLLLQGFYIQVTNPKALLFMSALLPQFIQPGGALALQLGVLLAITVAVDVLFLTAYACLALRGARSVRRPGVTAWLERAFGGALVFFGIRLLGSIRMHS
jgi:homoserine/homoserine lactone efflux protein